MWDVDECGAKSCPMRGPTYHRWVRHSPQSRSPGFGDTGKSIVLFPGLRDHQPWPDLSMKDVPRSKMEN